MAIQIKQLYYDSRPSSEREAANRGSLLAQYMAETTLGTWEVQVWENGGWHYGAISGILRVLPHGYSESFGTGYRYRQTKFTAYVDGGGGTKLQWFSESNSDIDPYQALLKAVRLKDLIIRRYLNDHEKSIATMHKLLIDLKKEI